MKILYLTCSEEDYLSDALLHGFRRHLGVNAVDYPRKDILYFDCTVNARQRIRGGGFTLYTGLLKEDVIDRSHIIERLQKGEVDLVVFSDISRQFGYFAQWRPYIHPGNAIIIDGSDSPQVYPHAGFWWRRPYYWFLPQTTCGFLYFKREWTEDSRFNLWHRFLPRRVRRALPHYAGLRPISFSIPEEKIIATLPIKSKDFPVHIVDPEVAAMIPGSATTHVFDNEEEYYADLQASRFGVTTKRAGWDCLRHYEIAANGCIPCFRDLQLKPRNCAPHGLAPGENCLSYVSAGDLFRQTAAVDPARYLRLQAGALAWARSCSTRERALEVIRVLEVRWSRSAGFPRRNRLLS